MRFSVNTLEDKEWLFDLDALLLNFLGILNRFKNIMCKIVFPFFLNDQFKLFN